MKKVFMSINSYVLIWANILPSNLILVLFEVSVYLLIIEEPPWKRQPRTRGICKSVLLNVISEDCEISIKNKILEVYLDAKDAPFSNIIRVGSFVQANSRHMRETTLPSLFLNDYIEKELRPLKQSLYLE